MKRFFFHKRNKAVDMFLQKHQKLISRICCPQCHGSLGFPGADFFEDIPLAGRIVCGQCGDVGRVSNLKLSFNLEELPSVSAGGKQLCGKLSVQPVTLAGDRFTPTDCWHADEGRFWSSHENARFSFTSSAQAVSLIFQKHPWAGIARILVDSVEIDTLDFFEEAGVMYYWYPINLDGKNHVVEVEVTGKKNSLSNDAQVFLIGAEELNIDAGADPAIHYKSGNDGNPYPDCFDRLIRDVDADGFILDCGSGARSHPDARIINFEYSHFSLPDIFGDGHKLPFKENSFDLILSQAVIEHLYDPFKAVDEMLRVLKPGGVVYAESAFMQPLHAVPFHFFNTTGWALENLFKKFHIINIGYKGELGSTLEWFYKLTSLREKGFGDKVDTMLDIARELDGYISAEELKHFASYVTILAEKSVD